MTKPDTPYQRLTAAAAQVTIDATYDDLVVQTDVQGLRELVERNRDVLVNARTHLGPECCVPLVNERDFFANNSNNIVYLRDLGRLFRAEGILAGFEKRYEDAAQVGLDLLQLSNATSRGGLKVDHMTSWMITLQGIDVIRRWRTAYEATFCSRLLAAVLTLDAQRDSWEVVVQRDREWEIAVDYEEEPIDWSEAELSDEDKAKMSAEEIADYEAMIEDAQNMSDDERVEMNDLCENRHICVMRLLMVDLAIRVYQGMTESYPETLEQLVPGVLETVPLDPFTQDDFIYQPMLIVPRRADDFLLYSPGPSQQDHGATFGPFPAVAAGVADLCLDEPDYWGNT